MGIRSTTRRFRPPPNVRATRLSWTPARPQEAQTCLDAVDRDDIECARGTDFDDRLGLAAIEGIASDDDFDFACFAIPLTRDDASSEEDAFEIEDREVFIFQARCRCWSTTRR